MRKTIQSHSKPSFNSQNQTKHFYVKLERLCNTPEAVISRIIKQNNSSFAKAIVYSETSQKTSTIFQLLNNFLSHNDVVISISQGERRQPKSQKIMKFISEGRILITDLKPNQLFAYQQSKFVFGINDVDLIINERLPDTKTQYFQRFDQIRKNDYDVLTIISVVKTLETAAIASQIINIQIQDFYRQNQILLRQNSNYRNRNFSNLPSRNRNEDNEQFEFGTLTTEFSNKSRSSQNINNELIKGKKIKKRNIRKSKDIFIDQSSIFQQGFNNQHSNKALQAKSKNQKNWIRSNVIGINSKFTSCLQLQLYPVYVDHTATNRSFKTIEDIILNKTKPHVANPHTEFSYFGQFSTGLMAYAKDSLLACFNSPEGQYTVLPAGAGSTGAIEKAVSFLKIWEQNQQYQWKNPIIFVTPYQHHSNILPWVQFYPQGSVKQLAHDGKFTLNLAQVSNQIEQCGTTCIIFSVSAASNVTSKLTHLKEVNDFISNYLLTPESMRIIKQKNIVFCVDCAAFCCHQQLDLQQYDQIDFAFLSPHKNLGGAESCGVLVARNNIINSSKPTFPGGGTVKFVKGYSREDVMYETGNFAREIAGTPPFFGFYRAALSFQLLTNRIGYEFIHDQETNNINHFFKKVNEQNNKLRLQKAREIKIYGDMDPNERANVESFNFANKDGQIITKDEYPAHNLISRILSDLFGIQVRSGCFCAGPYGIKLLQITQTNIKTLQKHVEDGQIAYKPGYVRLDLAFYLELYQVEYIVSAISTVAQYWNNLSKIYHINNKGQIKVIGIEVQKQTPIYSLIEYDQMNANGDYNRCDGQELGRRQKNLKDQLKQGIEIAKNPRQFVARLGQKHGIKVQKTQQQLNEDLY